MRRNTTTRSESARRKGREVQAAVWAARHPGVVATPTAVGAGSLQFGAATTGAVVAGTAAGLAGWYRAHPDSYDRWAGPLLRSQRRRWTTYLGWRWAAALEECDLTRVHRKTGERRVPRILRVRSYSPTVDVIRVRILPGQHARQFESKLLELADALKVERIAVERIRPQVIGLVVQRREPFTEIIDAPEMVYDADAVDIANTYFGETEYGSEWRDSAERHLFVVGATGAGKNSICWSALRVLAPLIRDGLVRLWVCDPKQMEFSKLAGVAHRYAADEDSCAELIDDYVADMNTVQADLSATQQRKYTMSRSTPLNILIIDELAALVAYNDQAGAGRSIRKGLGKVGTQGRATGHRMWGFVQEPSKDIVPMRDLFDTRICLRTTAASHVDMALGEGARLRGALADEIPAIPETAGIGYVIRQRTRVPMRVRAAYVDDTEIDELVAFIRPHQSEPAVATVNAGEGLKVVA